MKAVFGGASTVKREVSIGGVGRSSQRPAKTPATTKQIAALDGHNHLSHSGLRGLGDGVFVATSVPLLGFASHFCIAIRASPIPVACFDVSVQAAPQQLPDRRGRSLRQLPEIDSRAAHPPECAKPFRLRTGACPSASPTAPRRTTRYRPGDPPASLRPAPDSYTLPCPGSRPASVAPIVSVGEFAPSLRLTSGGLHCCRQPKIQNLHRAVIADLHVGRLQVTMHHALFVRGFESVSDLRGDLQRLPPAEARPSGCGRPASDLRPAPSQWPGLPGRGS